jgi:hypothetical protein
MARRRWTKTSSGQEVSDDGYRLHRWDGPHGEQRWAVRSGDRWSPWYPSRRLAVSDGVEHLQRGEVDDG